MHSQKNASYSGSEIWNYLGYDYKCNFGKAWAPISRQNMNRYYSAQLLIFKPLSYCFEETIGFDVKASFVSRPVSRLIRWYNKPGDITKEFWQKAIQFYGTYHGLKIANWQRVSRVAEDLWGPKLFHRSRGCQESWKSRNWVPLFCHACSTLTNI